LGDGCDSIHLIKNGFDVTSNEIDLLFLRKARENSRLHNTELKVTQYDWCNLGRHLGTDGFDAVLCLGNSLTYLFRKKDRINALGEFHKILRPGGIILVDERNYPYILENKEEILQGNFRYSGKYVYCGKDVRGFPIKITNRAVKWKYVHSKTGKIGFLDMHPFKEGQVLKELSEAGFSEVKQFSDYREGVDETADFFQYVARK
jgi:SAM-dependent methyltransferase